MSLTSEASSMVKEIIRTLRESNESLVTAESITAGGLSAAITSVAGSSQIFLGAIVAYQDHVKTDVACWMDKIIKWSYETFAWVFILMSFAGNIFMDKPIESVIYTAVLACFFLIASRC